LYGKLSQFVGGYTLAHIFDEYADEFYRLFVGGIGDAAVDGGGFLGGGDACGEE